jgi:predicted CoA-binding protein
MSHEKEPDDYLEKLTKRQSERLAAKPATEGLAEKMERVREAGMKADAERKAHMAEAMAAPYGTEEAKAEPIEGIITAWIPEPDPHIRAAVGKLAEELNEAAKVCARIAIQGLEGVDPQSKRLNSEELYRELADVMAATDVVELFVAVPASVNMADRRQRKREGFLKWHGMIRDHFNNLRRAAGMKEL